MRRSSWLGGLYQRFARFSHGSQAARSKRRVQGTRLTLRHFEERVVPSTVTWVGPATGGDWSQAAYWSGGTLPGAQDDVMIPANVAVTHSGGSDTINSLSTGGGDNLSISGGLAINTDSTFNGSVSLSGGASLGGTGNLTITGSFTFGGSNANSLLDGPAGSTLTVYGDIQAGAYHPYDSTLVVQGRTLINAASSTATISGSTDGVNSMNIALNSGGGFINNGTLDLAYLTSIYNNSTTDGLFTNNGTVVQSAGAGQIYVGQLTNNGSLTVQAGTFLLGYGSSHTLNAGTITAAAGTELDILGSSFTEPAGASLTGDRVLLSASQGTVGGTYEASTATTVFGNYQFTGPVTAVGILSLSGASADFSPASGGPATIMLAGLELTQRGWLGGTDNFIVTGGFLWGGNNGGSSVPTTLAGPAGSFLTAEGGISTALAGTLALDGRTLNNAGTASWHNDPAVSVIHGGTLNNLPGATFGSPGNTATLYLDSGTLAGSGTVNGSVDNAGFVVPGGTGQAGILTVNGSYTQEAGGALNIEVGGSSPAVDADQLAVNGPVSLAGTLNVALLDPFTACGDTVPVLTFTSRSGDFATETGLGLPNGQSITPVYTSIALNLVVPRITVTLGLSSSVSPSVFGQPVTVNATVTSTLPEMEQPTGTVQFQVDGTNVGTPVSLSNGLASFNTALLSVAGHTITALYSGDGCFLPGSGTTAQTVTPASATVGVASSANPAVSGQAVTFTATVLVTAPGSAAAASPTGAVTFEDGSTVIGTGTLSTVGGVTSASFTTSSLSGGSHTITAVYPGDGNFLSGSGSLAQAVIPILILDPMASGAFTLSGNATLTTAGAVIVDSSAATALTANGNAGVTAGQIGVVGGVQRTANASLNPTPATGITPYADPLAGLGGPSIVGLNNYGAVSYTSGTHTLQPGIYSQIKLSGTASVTLSPGLYLIEGGGLAVTGGGSLTGDGVMLYNTGSNYPNPGGSFGGLTLAGNGTVHLTASATSTNGTDAGVVIFQARANTRALGLSGNAAAGLGGIVYAPTAQLVLGGNTTLHAALIVDELQLNGNGISTQVIAGMTGDNSALPDTLLAGDLNVYVNDPSGLLTANELARIQDAITAWDSLLAPYNVVITQVSDPSQANVVIDTGSTSAAGSAADGVLGCYNDATREITLLQGWNWYDGSDASQIGAGQYDFQTVVAHELGHAVGLGGSSNTASPMDETLPAGAVRRTPTAADLNIPEAPEGADPEWAALPSARGGEGRTGPKMAAVGELEAGGVGTFRAPLANPASGTGVAARPRGEDGLHWGPQPGAMGKPLQEPLGVTAVAHVTHVAGPRQPDLKAVVVTLPIRETLPGGSPARLEPPSFGSPALSLAEVDDAFAHGAWAEPAPHQATVEGASCGAFLFDESGYGAAAVLAGLWLFHAADSEMQDERCRRTLWECATP